MGDSAHHVQISAHRVQLNQWLTYPPFLTLIGGKKCPALAGLPAFGGDNALTFGQLPILVGKGLIAAPLAANAAIHPLGYTEQNGELMKRRRNPKWPFDRPDRVEVVDLDPANLHQRFIAGKPCVTCGRAFDQITEPGACPLCQSVVEWLDSSSERLTSAG